MKILVADSVSERAVEILREQESWDVVFLPKKAGANVAEEIRDADALVVRSATKVTAQLLAKRRAPARDRPRRHGRRQCGP